jgi:hypothetical protein
MEENRTALAEDRAGKEAVMQNDPALPSSAAPNRPAAGPTPEDVAASITAQAAGLYLYASMTTFFPQNLTPATFLKVMATQVEAAGNPKDPVERMMVEQLVICHHNLGRIWLRGSLAKSVEEARVYHAAAAHLMAEYRRSALALRTYRAPVKENTISVRHRCAFAGRG